MSHRYHIGESVYFRGQSGAGAAGTYKIVRRLPVERDTALRYRIKNTAETFERVADEEQLSRTG